MTDKGDFRKLAPNPKSGLYSPDHVTAGVPIPK